MKKPSAPLQTLLSLPWEDALALLARSGVTWEMLKARVQRLADRTGLAEIESSLLLAVSAHQFSGDQWLPMMGSIEELSVHLFEKQTTSMNVIVAGTSRVLRERWVFVAADGKWRIAPEIAAVLTQDPNVALRTILDQRPGWHVEDQPVKSYALWHDEDVHTLRRWLDAEPSQIRILTEDVYLDTCEIRRIASTRPLCRWSGSAQDLHADGPVLPALAGLGAVIIGQDARAMQGIKGLHVLVLEGKDAESASSVEWLPRANYAEGELWAHECRARGITLTEEEIIKLRALFRIRLERIDRVLNGLTLGGRNLTFSEIAASARRIGARRLEAFSKRIEPRYQWDDLVLPPRTKLKLAEIYQHVLNKGKTEQQWGLRAKHNRGHGVTIVFEGESGTGKTMAAEVLAHALGLSLFQVDLSKLTSKYVGDTEKNLAVVFEAAREACGILFFDEGETLFSRRTDSHTSQDRYANLETNFLLQELENFDGIVVISTNLAQNIDAAFLRRITFQIGFPRPDAATRESIWRSHLQPMAQGQNTGISEDVDFQFLGQLPVSGGVIKNIARLAISWAAKRDGLVTMRDVLWGIRREFPKLGLPLDREVFGEERWRHVSPEWELVHAQKRQQELRPQEGVHGHATL